MKRTMASNLLASSSILRSFNSRQVNFSLSNKQEAALQAAFQE